MKYRSEIDGLRALAVIPVILYHAGIELFSGGFIGVDVFFVISGYLITTIIHDEIQNHTFSIVNFYERRIRRILPALFFVILTCMPFAWLWLLPGEYKDFSQSLVAVNLFSSNILFWWESGYFAPAAELKPLLHTWSLAVEEQFYVFFPLLLLLCRKYRDRSLLILLIVIALLSLGLSEYSSRNYPTSNFYLLPSRAWELGVGGILAISAPYWRQVTNSTSQILSFLGMIMVIYSLVFFDESTPIPSSFGLIPVLGAALIIAYGTNETFVGKILGWKLFVGIGLISYSAYLWHHPLFSFARIRLSGEPTLIQYLLLSVLSLFLAYLTYRFIETPFRNKKKYSRNSMFAGALIISVIFIFLGSLGHVYNGFDNRLSIKQKEVLSFIEYDQADAYSEGTCFMQPDHKYTDFKAKCYSSAGAENSLMIWGDSHAGALSYGLRKNYNNVSQLTASACAPLIEYDPKHRPNCKNINNFVFEKIKQLKPGVLILHADWIGVASLNKIKYGLNEALSETISYINSISPKTRIVVVGGAPQWTPNLPSLLALSNIELQDEAFVYTRSYDNIQAKDAVLNAVSNQYGATFVSLINQFCVNKKCLSSVKQGKKYEPFAWDYAHLTRLSSYLVAEKVLFYIGIDKKEGGK